jgi:hypothetical protein
VAEAARREWQLKYGDGMSAERVMWEVVLEYEGVKVHIGLESATSAADAIEQARAVLTAEGHTIVRADTITLA